MKADSLAALGRTVWKVTLVLVLTIAVMWAIGWAIGAVTGGRDEDVATVTKER